MLKLGRSTFCLAVAAAAGLLLLAGCAVGPRYSRPPAPAPTDYKETPANWKQAQPSDQVLRGKWWEIYQDDQLNSLEEKISISNQTLKASLAQFEQARAQLHYYRADLYPTISAGVSATRERLSRNRPLGASTGAAGASTGAADSMAPARMAAVAVIKQTRSTAATDTASDMVGAVVTAMPTTAIRTIRPQTRIVSTRIRASLLMVCRR